MQRLPFLSLLLPALLAAHDPGLISNMEVEIAPDINPWTNLDFNDDPDHFHFAVVTDRTGGARPGIFESAIDKLNLIQPEFVLCVGDLIQGYTEDEAELERQWDEFDSFVNRLQMPFFYVPGNHDISNPAMVEKWRQRRGRPYYHFVYRDVLFLILDTEDPPSASISAEQVAYFREVLGKGGQYRWILLFMHQPLWLAEEKTGFNDIEALLVGRPYTVFAGHHHTYGKYLRYGNRYYKLATTGGDSNLGGPGTGQFDHIAWVTMGDEGPIMGNLLLDGILGDEPDRLPEPTPDLSVSVRAPRSTIAVDGNPADWEGLNSDPVEISGGAGKLSCRIRYAWDDHYLYLLVRELPGDTARKEAENAAQYLESPWDYESIGFFIDVDNSNSNDGPRGDLNPLYGFSSAGRRDLYCAGSHRLHPYLCVQDLLQHSPVATGGNQADNSRIIEVGLRWEDIEGSVDRERLPGGLLPVLKPGLRLGSEPLLLDEGYDQRRFIGEENRDRPSGKDPNSRDILLTE